jgi:hypothetical protein
MADTPRKPKPTKAIVAQRVEEVLRIRLDGAEFWDVREYAREKEAEAGSAWELPAGGKPLSDGQLWRYIARADKLIAESCRASWKKLLRRHLAQRRNLFAKAVAQGDVRAALAVLDSEAKLTGLFDLELSQQLERLAKEIAELKAQHGNGNTPKTPLPDTGRPESAPSPGDADCRASAAGPDPDPDRSGDDARPLASRVDEEQLDESITPLFPPERQEPGCGSAGAG